MTAFDTLQAAHDLEAAGMDRVQAEAIAQVVRQGKGELATKADIEATAARLETSMLRLAFGIVAANTALTVSLLKLL